MEGITVFRTGTGSKLSFRSRTNLCPKRKLSRFSLAPFHGKPSKIVPLKANATSAFSDQLSTRKFEKLSTSDWTHQFHNVSLDVSEVDALRTEFDTLKPIIKNKFKSLEAKERILMIYSLVSLGVAYHFENEIFETLDESFEKIEQILDGEEDLYTVSIIFWVFRTYGHYISSDVFRIFKGDNGNFKESLTKDVKGMLSLYEAAHLGTPKEYIMDESLSFTTSHLESLATSGTCPPHLLKRIQSALTLSQHWNMKVLVQVEYIAFYEQEKDHDEMLLKFAKLNFKLLKLQYIQELKMVTKWYKELEFESTLPPYFRDRIVENHFFVQAVFLEPQLSHARILLIQYFTGLAILDDTFDRYASLSEAEGLANSMERWAFDHTMDKQPDYLKFVLKFLLDIFEEFERELRPEGRSYSVNAAKEEFKILVKANFDLAKWAIAAEVPSFDEYMKVGEVEITVCATLAGMFMSMANINAKDAYEWLKSRPKIVKYLSIKGRLMNDITGFKDDMSRGYVTNAVNCYMKQYGVTEEEASRELNKMVAEADKILNEEFLRTVGVEHRVLEATMDLARMITVSYNGDEGFTNPRGRIYENMASMFVDQINI